MTPKFTYWVNSNKEQKCQRLCQHDLLGRITPVISTGCAYISLCLLSKFHLVNMSYWELPALFEFTLHQWDKINSRWMNKQVVSAACTRSVELMKSTLNETTKLFQVNLPCNFSFSRQRKHYFSQVSCINQNLTNRFNQPKQIRKNIFNWKNQPLRC